MCAQVTTSTRASVLALIEQMTALWRSSRHKDSCSGVFERRVSSTRPTLELTLKSSLACGGPAKIVQILSLRCLLFYHLTHVRALACIKELWVMPVRNGFSWKLSGTIQRSEGKRLRHGQRNSKETFLQFGHPEHTHSLTAHIRLARRCL